MSQSSSSPVDPSTVEVEAVVVVRHAIGWKDTQGGYSCVSQHLFDIFSIWEKANSVFPYHNVERTWYQEQMAPVRNFGIPLY